MGYSWHQLSTKAQPWIAPVSVLGNSWPTFSLFLPVQSSLFTLLWAESFISPSVQNAKGVPMMSEWISCLVLEAWKIGSPFYCSFILHLVKSLNDFQNNFFVKKISLQGVFLQSRFFFKMCPIVVSTLNSSSCNTGLHTFVAVDVELVTWLAFFFRSPEEATITFNLRDKSNSVIHAAEKHYRLK